MSSTDSRTCPICAKPEREQAVNSAGHTLALIRKNTLLQVKCDEGRLRMEALERANAALLKDYERLRAELDELKNQRRS